jgi:hypothetical protein
MKDFKILTATALVLLTATIAAAQSGGGFPSRPTFQKITVNSVDNVQASIVNDSGTLVAGVYSLWSNGGVPVGLIGTGGVSGGGCLLGDFCLLSQKSGNSLRIGWSGGTALAVDSSGNVTSPSAASVPWPKFATTAMGITAGSACGFTLSRNIATCVRSGVGGFSGTLSGFTATPTCTASYQSSGASGAGFAGTIDVVASSATSISINTYNASGTLNDSQHNCGGGGACIQIVCVGV